MYPEDAFVLRQGESKILIYNTRGKLVSNIFKVIKALENGKRLLIAVGITEKMQQEMDETKYLMEYFNSYPTPKGRKVGNVKEP